jgi:hypothetical protein
MWVISVISVMSAKSRLSSPSLERRRIAGQAFPKIVHVLNLPRALDVVKHGADFLAGVTIFD